MVVHPNYRGSDGYGRTWQLANRYLVGQGEIQDVAGAHAFLVEQGCDPARIACTGRSWGGFHTMALLTQFPELWACGVAGVPFFDFIFAQGDPMVRDDLVWWDQQNSGRLPEDRARLEYYSPINHLSASRRRSSSWRPPSTRAARPGQVDEVVRAHPRQRRRVRGRHLPRRGPRDQRHASTASTTTGAPSSSSCSTSAA